MTHYVKLYPASLLAALCSMPESERGAWMMQLCTELITGAAKIPLAVEMLQEAKEFRQMKSELGKKGAASKWQSHGKAMAQPKQSQSKAMAEPWQSYGKPMAISSKDFKDLKEPKTYIPDCIDKAAWQSFIDNRKKLKSPMTERAQELMLSKLAKLHGEGWNVTDLLNESILHGWKDVYPKGTPSGEYGMTVTTVDGRKVTVAD